MDIKIETWEYELRQFIDNAIRWDISIYMKNRSNQLNYGIDHSIIVNARKHFEDFSNQLQIECDKTENDEGFEKKIKDRFLKGINRYYDFYSKNKEEIISLYTNNNGYSIMYELIKSTEREILLYYPGKQMSNEKDLTSFLWFQVGLKFATGEIQKLSDKGLSAPKICKELFNEHKVTSVRPYITESIGNSTARSQNIYSNNDHLLKIYNHCKENSITVVEEFKSRIQFD